MTYWTLQGKIINLNNIKTDILADDIDYYRLNFEDTRDGKGETSNPKEFSHEKWYHWEDRIYNYFTSRKKSCGVPLSYVTRKDTPSTKDSENRDAQIIYQASLVRNMFTRDSRKVLNIIKELNLGTDSETWIKVLKCGRKAMHELQAQYDGTPEGACRKQVYRADPNKILYKNETNFSFEKYVTKLKGILNVLEKYGVPLYEEQMVEHLLDHIISPNTGLKTDSKICRSSHSSTFLKASTYLYTMVARIHTSTNPSSGCSRKRISYATGHGDRGSKRGGRFNGRGSSRVRGGRGVQGRGGNGQGGCGSGSGTYEIGIDI